MEADIALVRSAIDALYGMNAEASNSANLFLMDVSEKPIAWTLGMQLLSNFNGNVNSGFFGANLLYSKVRRHWYQLDQLEREQFTNAILQFLQGSDRSQEGYPFPYIIMTKLCFLFAAIAVRSLDGPALLIKQGFSMIPSEMSDDVTNLADAGRLVLVLKMLTALTEESDCADISRPLRLELEEGLINTAPHAIQAVQRGIEVAMTLNSNPKECSELIFAAVNCFSSWIECGITLSSLVSRYRILFDLLITIMGALPGLPIEGGQRYILEGLSIGGALCGAFETIFVVEEYPRPATRTVAVEALLSGMSCLPRVFATAAQRGDEDICSIVCRAATTIAEVETEFVAGTNAPSAGLELVEFILAMTGCPLKKIALLTLDFWLQLQDLPIANRHASLSHEIYKRLLEVLLRQCEYPEGFTSWEKHDSTAFDEDVFKDLRDGATGVKDVLVVVYYLLRSQYLELVLGYLTNSQNSWQAIESCLLMVTHVAKETKAWISSPEKSQEGINDAARTETMLRSLLQQIVSNTSISTNSIVFSGGCKLVGAFAPLLINSNSADPGDNPLLVPALRYLTAALHEENARFNASMAVRNVCAVCELQILFDATAIEVLLPQLKVAQMVRAPIEDQLALAEAVSRLLACMEPQKASHLLIQFSSPLLQVLNDQLSGQHMEVSRVSEALQILSQVVRFLDAAPDAEGNHVSAAIIETLWPYLDAIAKRCQANDEILIQLFSLLGRLIGSLRALPMLKTLLPSLLGIMLNSYQNQHFPCCLECMKIAVEAYSTEMGETEKLFEQLLVHVCADTFDYLKRGHPPNTVPQLMAAFFSLIHRYLLFRPSQLLQGPDLGTITDLAAACMNVCENESLERDSSRSVLVFLSNLAQRCNGKLDKYINEVDSVLVKRGSLLCSLLLKGLAIGAPSMLWSNIIDCLYSILHEYVQRPQKEMCREWISSTVFDSSITKALSANDRQQLVDAILKLALENRPRFKALMLDFAKICHHEMTPDGLLAYFITSSFSHTIHIE